MHIHLPSYFKSANSVSKILNQKNITTNDLTKADELLKTKINAVNQKTIKLLIKHNKGEISCHGNGNVSVTFHGGEKLNIDPNNETSFLSGLINIINQSNNKKDSILLKKLNRLTGKENKYVDQAEKLKPKKEPTKEHAIHEILNAAQDVTNAKKSLEILITTQKKDHNGMKEKMSTIIGELKNTNEKNEIDKISILGDKLNNAIKSLEKLTKKQISDKVPLLSQIANAEKKLNNLIMKSDMPELVTQLKEIKKFESELAAMQKKPTALNHLQTAIAYFESNNSWFKEEGIFRVPGNDHETKIITSLMNQGDQDKIDKHLVTDKSSSNISSAIKKLFKLALTEKDKKNIEYIVSRYTEDKANLPPLNDLPLPLQKLQPLFTKILHYKEINKMDAENLGRMFGPNMMPDFNTSQSNGLNMVNHYNKFMSDIIIKMVKESQEDQAAKVEYKPLTIRIADKKLQIDLAKEALSIQLKALAEANPWSRPLPSEPNVSQTTWYVDNLASK